MALTTQSKSIPWSTLGVLKKRWLRQFQGRHPKLATRRSQGLEVARARALCPTIAETLYSNLEFLYMSYNYPANHIWNCDKFGVQAERSGGTIVLTKKGKSSIHFIKLDQKEQLSVLSCRNANGGCTSKIYILKGSYFPRGLHCKM